MKTKFMERNHEISLGGLVTGYHAAFPYRPGRGDHDRMRHVEDGRPRKIIYAADAGVRVDDNLNLLYELHGKHIGA